MKKLSIAMGVFSILLGIAVFIWRTTLFGDFYDTGTERVLATVLGLGLVGGGAMMIAGGMKKPSGEE